MLHAPLYALNQARMWLHPNQKKPYTGQNSGPKPAVRPALDGWHKRKIRTATPNLGPLRGLNQMGKTDWSQKLILVGRNEFHNTLNRAIQHPAKIVDGRGVERLVLPQFINGRAGNMVLIDQSYTLIRWRLLAYFRTVHKKSLLSPAKTVICRRVLDYGC